MPSMKIKKIYTKQKALIVCGYKIDSNIAYTIEECFPFLKPYLIYNSPMVSDNDANIVFGIIIKEVQNYELLNLIFNEIQISTKKKLQIWKDATDTALIPTYKKVYLDEDDKEGLENKIMPEYYLMIQEEIV